MKEVSGEKESMAAPAPTTHWLPKDDLLLKNAIEAGASLEALAKGAVKFSQKFSLQQLRDRWHSLLYDEDVAIEASRRMLEAEAAGSSRQSKKKAVSGSPGKRKAESLRQMYHKMRRRRRKIPVDDLDFDFLNETDAFALSLFNQLPTDGFPSVALDTGFFENDIQGEFLQMDDLGRNSLESLGLRDDMFKFDRLEPTFADVIKELPPDSSLEFHEADDDEMTDGWTSVLDYEDDELEVPTSGPDKESGVVENSCFEVPTQQRTSCCTLNIEETEIPDNEDVFLPVCSAPMPKESDDYYYRVPVFAGKLSHKPESSSRAQNADVIQAESDGEGYSDESDDELPYFSDVEEMIDDMDLCPDDIDVLRNPTVVKYQDDEVRTRIIRLEQAARAATDRYIAARGAYAVLYSRHSKHLVQKPEVVIGRGTEEIKVDIDLRKEACAKKVSRRQATLKLENDGTFHLRNLGKHAISVNGKRISPGKTSSLTNGCLIEISDVAFLFDMNEKSCKAAAAERNP